MPTQMPDFKDLMAANPQVDGAEVREVIETMAQLQKYGVDRANYSLVSPYSRGHSDSGVLGSKPRLRFTR